MTRPPPRTAPGGSTGATASRESVGPRESRRANIEPWRQRRQLERQLHDGASLRISALALRLGMLRGRAEGSEAEWCRTVTQLQDELHLALQELREVERALYPALLAEAGLGPALRELAEQHGARVGLVVSDDRFGPAAEGAAYFAVSDWLASLELESPASAVPASMVTVRRDRDDLVLTLSPCLAGQLEQVRVYTGPLGGRELLDNNTLTVRMACG